MYTRIIIMLAITLPLSNVWAVVSPSDIDGLVCWYDAQDLVDLGYGQGSLIDVWPNKGPAGDLLKVPLIPGLSNKAPALQLAVPQFNNYPGVVCDNPDKISFRAMYVDGDVINSYFSEGPITIFMIARDATAGFLNAVDAVSFGGASPRLQVINNQFRVGGLAGVKIDQNGTTAGVRAYLWDGVKGGQGYIQTWINGTSQGIVDTTGVGGVGFVGQTFLFPAFATLSSAYHGVFGEIIIYNRALTPGELNAVGYSLAQKYAVASSYVNPEPLRNLTIAASPVFDGFEPELGIHSYYNSEIVTLNAPVHYLDCPDIYEFSHWAGSVDDPNSPVTTVMMDGDKTVTAYYTLSEEQCVTLTIGTNPAGIAGITPAEGEYVYAKGETVNLAAIERIVDCPNVWEFSTWSENVANPTISSTSITLDSNEVVVANFLDARKCGDECHPYPEGDLSKDCHVDLSDLSVLAENWLKCSAPECQ